MLLRAFYYLLRFLVWGCTRGKKDLALALTIMRCMSPATVTCISLHFAHPSPILLCFSGRLVTSLRKESRSNHLERGDRVVVGAGMWCGQCSRCLESRTNICENGFLYGIHAHGGLAEQALFPAKMCVWGPGSMFIPGRSPPMNTPSRRKSRARYISFMVFSAYVFAAPVVQSADGAVTLTVVDREARDTRITEGSLR